jgi:hypothetical protein
MIQTIQRIIIVICLLIAFQKCNAQRVFTTDATWRPGNRVFVVDQAYKADLLVYEVEYAHQAKGKKGLWKVVDKPWKADYVVIFVDKPWKADFLIYFCDRAYQAGFRDAEGRRKAILK